MLSNTAELQIEKERLRLADDHLRRLMAQKSKTTEIFSTIDASIRYIKSTLVPASEFCESQITIMNEIDEAIVEVDGDYERIKQLNRITFDLQRKIGTEDLEKYIGSFKNAIYLRSLFSSDSNGFSDFDKRALQKLEEALKLAYRQMVALFDSLLVKLFNLERHTQSETISALKSISDALTEARHDEHMMLYVKRRAKEVAEKIQTKMLVSSSSEVGASANVPKKMTGKSEKHFQKETHPVYIAVLALGELLDEDRAVIQECMPDSYEQLMSRLLILLLDDLLLDVQNHFSILQTKQPSLDKILFALESRGAFLDFFQSSSGRYSVGGDQLAGCKSKLIGQVDSYVNEVQKKLIKLYGKESQDKVKNEYVLDVFVDFGLFLKSLDPMLGSVDPSRLCIEGMVEALLDNLERKAKKLKSKNKICGCMLKLNNLYYLNEKVFQMTKKESIAQLLFSKLYEHISTAFKNELMVYITECWDKAIAISFKKDGGNFDIKLKCFNSCVKAVEESHEGLWILNEMMAKKVYEFHLGTIAQKYLGLLAQIKASGQAPNLVEHLKYTPDQTNALLRKVILKE